jgi:hypothetical protein
MTPYALTNFYLMVFYYVIIGIFALLGGAKLIYDRKRKKEIISPEIVLTAFLLLVFLLSMLLRVSTRASPLSWTYDMSLRGTIWAFLGLSFIGAIGFRYALKISRHSNLLRLSIAVSTICILAAGKFAQYPLIVSDSAIIPDVTYSRYVGSLWLKQETIHGSNMLIAPYTADQKAFEASRSMAPYAYLRQFFGEETEYESFNGYIPFVGSFFDKFNNSHGVNIIYNNGETKIGYARGST